MTLKALISSKSLVYAICLAFILTFCLQNAPAQSNQIDPGFNPLPSKDAGNGDGLTLQPDGKILIYANFDFVDGVQRAGMARLNADGSLDASFNCSICSTFKIGSAVVQPDGKILIAGFFQNSTGIASRMYRINADGSTDNTFNSPLNGTPSFTITYTAHFWAAGADGKSYGSVSGSGSFFNQLTLYRFNNDGSIDTTFASLIFNLRNRNALTQLRLLPDGKLLISGAYSYGYLFRVNTDGTKDTTFESPLLTYSFTTQLSPLIAAFDIQADGKIPFVGRFTSVNGFNRSSFARANVDGSLDLAFNPNPVFPIGSFLNISRLALQPGGKIIVQGENTANGLLRYNQDGTVDNTFNTTVTNFVTVDGFGRIYILTASGYARLNADGTPDPTFISPVLGIAGSVTTLAVQNNGKILAGGDFIRINNVTHNRLVRLNADATIDSTFNAGSGPDSVPGVITVQADGKIIIGGGLSSYNGTPVSKIARLNADGSLDNSFVPVFNDTVSAIAVQADGKILVGGSFTAVNNLVRNGLVRLNADGSLDNTFTVVLSTASIRSIIVQPDGKVVIGGSFSGINGFARSNMARLNADGSTDASFNAGSIVPALEIIRQPHGKYLVRSNQILRRNADGSADSTFQIPNITTAGSTTATLTSIVLKPNGMIIVSGNFDTVNGNPRRNIARLKSDGTLDTFFLPVGTNAPVNDLAEQPDGKTVVGGSFKNIENVSRLGLARVENVPALKFTPFDFDGDGRADIGVFRPTNNVWYQLLGVNNQFFATEYGLSGDLLTPADYDGDGKTDLAIFRQSSGDWVYASSVSNNIQLVTHWGQNGDVPLPSDFNGDGKADFIVFRPSNGMWYRYANGTGATSFIAFGAPGDKPLIGDFDGDGKSDPAVFRPSTGEWFYASSSQNGVHLRAALWGLANDKLVPADYDGDGKTDAAIFRDGLWAITNSSNGTNTILTFGQTGDKPAAADYDGDGKADIAVYRPSDGTWYLMRSSSGFGAVGFGASIDVPLPNVYVR